jgi:hypothetical protein
MKAQKQKLTECADKSIFITPPMEGLGGGRL